MCKVVFLVGLSADFSVFERTFEDSTDYRSAQSTSDDSKLYATRVRDLVSHARVVMVPAIEHLHYGELRTPIEDRSAPHRKEASVEAHCSFTPPHLLSNVYEPTRFEMFCLGLHLSLDGVHRLPYDGVSCSVQHP